jgi:hypothetical protein
VGGTAHLARTDRAPVGHLLRLAAPGASSDGSTGRTQFSGWLGLLRALSDALGNAEDIRREP